MNQTATLNQNEIREIYNNNTQTLYDVEINLNETDCLEDFVEQIEGDTSEDMSISDMLNTYGVYVEYNEFLWAEKLFNIGNINVYAFKVDERHAVDNNTEVIAFFKHDFLIDWIL